MKSLVKINSVLLCLITISGGCSPIIHHQGKLVEDETLKEVSCGRHTREDVERILGSPSTISNFNHQTWYYISKTTQATAFLTPKVIDQKAVAITFDERGYVKEVSECKLADARDIEFIERITPTTGHSISFLQQVFGNFGRINRQDKRI